MDISKIQALCKANGITIRDVEKASGIGNGVIGKWGNHNGYPRVTSIKKIADYFGCTVDDLLPDISEQGTKV